MDPFRPGSTVGKYQLLRRLGKGGAGEVWEASLSLQSIVTPAGARAKLQGSVALKLISLEDAMGAAETLTLNLLGNLRHSNLVEYRDAFQYGNYCVIAMSLCDGSMMDRAKECRRSGAPGIARDELLEYFHDAARAIDFLHSRDRSENGDEGGIIHGDIKPHNLLLSGGSVRVADFGLAKLASGARLKSEQIGFSLHYVAPEAANGLVSKFSDQYSLAATYYELRTGHTIYSGASHHQVMIQVASPEPPALDRIAHPGERAVLQRALDKTAEKRWPTCVEFIRKLGEAARYEPPTTKSQRMPDTEPINLPGIDSDADTSEWATKTKLLAEMNAGKAKPSTALKTPNSGGRGRIWVIAAGTALFLAAGGAAVWQYGPWKVVDQQTDKGMWNSTIQLTVVPDALEVTALGGAFVEHPDGQLTIRGRPGETTITVKAIPGYEDRSEKIVLKANEHVALRWQLTPKDALVSLSALPPQATVTASMGVLEGGGPDRKLRVAKPQPGTRVKLHAEASGHRTMDVELEVGPGEKKEVSLNLPSLPAEWTLTFDPPEATVDGKSLPVGVSLSPAVGSSRKLIVSGEAKSAGDELSLSFAAKGYGKRTERFRFNPGERTERTIHLERENGGENTIGMRLVRIAPGTFARGPGDEVRITKEFLIGEAEVTQEQFGRVMGGEAPSASKGEPTLPVERVDWYSAVKFCNRLSDMEKAAPFYSQLRPGDPDSIVETGSIGYRLPTEAEWEYACRAGSRSRWCFGDAVGELGRFGWFRDNGEGRPHPVKGREPNAFGLYDLHGNVREWCWDFFDPDYYSKPESRIDPRGPKQGVDRVVRGGCFDSSPAATACGHRISSSPDSKSQVIGFRVARNAR